MKLLLGAAIIMGGVFMTKNLHASSYVQTPVKTNQANPVATYNAIFHQENVTVCPFKLTEAQRKAAQDNVAETKNFSIGH